MILISIIGSIALLWLALTLLAQRKNSGITAEIGAINSVQKALIVYNPDLFYNLDEQVCKAFANGLSENGWYAQVVTVASAEKMIETQFDLFVFCANTYNWAPDRPTTSFIKNNRDLNGKPVVAITLGSGSTSRAKRFLERTIQDKDAKLIGSKDFWLLKPNDDSRTNKSNITIAVERAKNFGKQIAQSLQDE